MLEAKAHEPWDEVDPTGDSPSSAGREFCFESFVPSLSDCVVTTFLNCGTGP